LIKLYILIYKKKKKQKKMKQIWVKKQDVEKVNNDILVTECRLEAELSILESGDSQWVSVYVTDEYLTRLKGMFTLTENKKVILG
jgi:hypothetical protein